MVGKEIMNFQLSTKVIVVEINHTEIDDVKNDSSSKFIFDLGYKVIAKKPYNERAAMFFVC